MWTIFKVFIKFVTVLLLFYVLVFWPRGMWDLSSMTRSQTCTPCIGRGGLNHWATREVARIYLTELHTCSSLGPTSPGVLGWWGLRNCNKSCCSSVDVVWGVLV